MTSDSFLRSRPFPSHRNSMNMFRLVFAAMVLFAHSWFTAGQGTGPGFRGENLGGWAVAGFFVLSGFLITGSRISHNAGEFLVHRVARIFPAFLVCLAITAFVFAPVALYAQHHSLSGYFSTPSTPLNYIWSNAGLHMDNYGIGQSLDTVPYKDAWDGSLWTLYYEFLCYLIIWVLGGLLVFRRSIVPMIVLWALSVLNYAGLGLAQRLGLNQDYLLLSRLLPYFLGGSIAYFVIRRWGISPVIGIVSALAAAACICFIPGFGGQASAPFLAYALIWLSTLIPQPAFIARNDISYGFYIYAWPMQQLVAVFGGASHGMWLYWAITAVLTTAFATASWFLVERPVLRLVKRSRVVVPASPVVEQSAIAGQSHGGAVGPAPAAPAEQ
ncbi:acyltransferase [Planctomonas sp. JC2975]|uniref:acyltransferase family protein n=1 Tax=Planctomonas sp. JC2975 TaxID=2729626 RepID=UPI0014733424|nr:acyltransferase [Planctomonas sp. JC2975]NNC13083.1 acyltransferase [Planctomonas sp. JC2975]